MHSSDLALWNYNAQDCVRTFEIAQSHVETIRTLGLEEQNAFQHAMLGPVLQAMIRGVRIDKEARKAMRLELNRAIKEREKWIAAVLGHPLNVKSPKQMQTLFYEDFLQRKILKRRADGKSTPTLDDDALATLAKRQPLLTPLVKRIQDMRSMGVFLNTFVRAPLDTDERMRCSYNICGTVEYRLASSTNAFGSGTNLQNVPAGDEGAGLPNIRKIFVPDEGCTIFDRDLSKADLRVVVWEADEGEMKAMLQEGKDPYVEIAREFYRDPSITKTRADGSTHPAYKTFKAFAHGTHYFATPNGIAQSLGLSRAEADRTQKWYFGKFPRIKEWQDDFRDQVKEKRMIRNAYGFIRHFFGRVDDAAVREGAAWLAASTVALTINKIWLRIYREAPEIQVLLQVHDSLVGQFPTPLTEPSIKKLDDLSHIEIPYPDPLVIPSGMKTSTKSWGDVS